MNKIIAVLLLLIIVFGGAFLYLNSSYQKDATPEDDPEQSSSDEQPSSGEKDDGDDPFRLSETSEEYQIKTLLIRDPGDIALYSNLEDKLSSSDAMVKNDCSDLVTAGFYTKEFDHIGLFISDYIRLSGSSSTLASSGYFSIDSNNTPSITVIEPPDSRIAVQSYPLVYQNGEPVEIVNNTENNARRIIAATTNDQDVIFIVIYQKNSVFDGPTLSEIPELISLYDDKERTKIDDAINLDGGAHSAFRSRFVNLPELSTLGGYFCMRY